MKSYSYIFLSFCSLIGLISLNQVFVKEGHQYNTTCTYDTDEYLIWVFPNKSRIEENNKSNRIYAVKEGNTLRLVFEFVLMKDTGKYECCNFGNTANCFEFDLAVIGTPKFAQDYESHDLLEGDNINLFCDAVGYPYPSYHWLDNNQKEMDEQGENWKIDNDTLSITLIKKSQEGLYTCEARNELGNASKLYLVTINAKPTSINLQIKANFITSTSIQFSIDIGKKLYNYVVASYTEKTLYIPAVKYWTLGEVYLLYELKFNTAYEFKFGVSNTKKLANVFWDKPVYEFQTARNLPNLIIDSVTSTTVKVQWPYRNLNEISGPNTADFYLLSYVKLEQKSGNFYKSACPMNITIPACYGRSYTIAGLSSNRYYSIGIRIHYPFGWSDVNELTVYTGSN